MRYCIIIILLNIFLIPLNSFSQAVTGSFIINKGANVSFNLYSINQIRYGVVRQDYTTLLLSFEDVLGNDTYSGFALYAQALATSIEGTSNAIPLNKIKLTCSGNEVSDVTYVADTSEVNSKLTTAMTPICYWETTEGVSRSDEVKISYYIDPLIGFDSDNYNIEIDFTLRSYTGTP